MQLTALNKYNSFFTDDETIYYQNYGMKAPHPIPGVDKNSFKIETIYLAWDKNKVYAISSMREGLQIFEPADMKSVVFIENNDSHFADQYNLYHYNLHFIEYCNINGDNSIKEWLKKNKPNVNSWYGREDGFYENLTKINENIFAKENQLFYYFKEDKSAYDFPLYSAWISGFNGFRSTYEACYLELRNVDKATFKVLNNIYSKDETQVYFYSRIIAADAKSFEVIGQFFAKDIQGIWFNGRLCSNIEDINSFEVLKSGIKRNQANYARDKHNIYAALSSSKIGSYEGYAVLLKKIKGFNPKAFEYIDDFWAKDNSNVYWCGKIFNGADAATFTKIDNKSIPLCNWAKDKNHVYRSFDSKIIKGLDSNSFEILNKYWAKDKFVVYSLAIHKIQKSIDVNSFAIKGDNGGAKDKNYDYETKDFRI